MQALVGIHLSSPQYLNMLQEQMCPLKLRHVASFCVHCVLWKSERQHVLGCEWKFSGLCATSIPFVNASHATQLSRNLSQYLTGNWSRDLDGMLRDLRQSIAHINSTWVDVSLAGGLTNWITTVASRLKEWAGIVGLALCLVLTSFLAFWCMCHLWFRQHNTRSSGDRTVSSSVA